MPVRALSLLVVLLGLVPAAASAKVVNVELKFTPYVGAPAKEDKVQSVAGVAALFVNGIPYGEQPVEKTDVPVQFAERELGPSVWIPVESLGPVVRRGKNTIRIEFTPADEQREYRARLAWATVTDEETHGQEDGKATATNQADAGKAEKIGKGKLALEHEFVADFVPDLPWHHYAPISEVGDGDKKELIALVMKRVGLLKPDFKGMYEILAGNPRIELDKIKSAKCVDAAYAAGVRIDAPQFDDVLIIPTGHPEVMLIRKDGKLFRPTDAGAFVKLKDEQTQMCAAIALSLVFPPQLVVVREPSGAWRVVY